MQLTISDRKFYNVTPPEDFKWLWKFTMNDTTIAFLGLGLIGGSLAKGIKRARPDIRIMAYMRTRSKLEQAKKTVL